jgi:hypothetical protein
VLALGRICLVAGLLAAMSAFAQSGLRLPERGEQGLDPSFARGWLAPEYDRFGFATYQWRDPYSFALEPRPLSVFGRYWLSPDWALSAESASRDPTGLFRLQDFRIGVQRRF